MNAQPLFKNPIERLETERLFLEPLAPHHVPGLQHYFSEWDVLKYIGSVVPYPLPADSSAKYVASVVEKMGRLEAYGWALVRKAEPSEAVGCIGIEWRQDHWRRGFWIGVPFQKQGFMSEALPVATDFIFFRGGIDSFFAPTFVGNEGSTRVKEKLPGKIVRREPIDEPRPGTPFTEQDVWQITAEEWQASRGA